MHTSGILALLSGFLDFLSTSCFTSSSLFSLSSSINKPDCAGANIQKVDSARNGGGGGDGVTKVGNSNGGGRTKAWDSDSAVVDDEGGDARVREGCPRKTLLSYSEIKLNHRETVTFDGYNHNCHSDKTLLNHHRPLSFIIPELPLHRLTMSLQSWKMVCLTTFSLLEKLLFSFVSALLVVYLSFSD